MLKPNKLPSNKSDSIAIVKESVLINNNMFYRTPIVRLFGNNGR